MSPTEWDQPDRRDLVTGHFHERVGYEVVRETGCHDWLIIYTLSGGGLIMHRNGQHAVGPHEVVLFRPGCFHGYQTDPAVGRWELLWAHFVPPDTWLAWLNWPELAEGVMHLSLADRGARQRVIDHLAQAHRIMSGYHRRRVPLGLNALEAALLWCDECNPRSAYARLDLRIREAVDYLCRHLAEPITLDSLARVCKLSPSRLSHLFRQQVGETPMRFLEQQRIARARQLLELTTSSVAEVARQVGFENPFYFTLRFKRATGQSPSQYRAAFAPQRLGGSQSAISD
ncbi:MAG TPA: helix-turn-helix domain-containing protein [Phycisphaeraceae bacterium]